MSGEELYKAQETKEAKDGLTLQPHPLSHDDDFLALLIKVLVFLVMPQATEKLTWRLLHTMTLHMNKHSTSNSQIRYKTYFDHAFASSHQEEIIVWILRLRFL
jgi:hypothetical protein